MALKEGRKDLDSRCTLVINQMVTGSTLNTLRCSDHGSRLQENKRWKVCYVSVAAVWAGELTEGHSCVFGKML